MSRFAIRNPYFIVVICLFISVVGITSLARMPVDMFPAMNIPRGGGGDFLFRYAAGTDRDRHHQPL